MSYIEENLIKVRKEINDTCEKIGRNPEEVNLIAVTKTIDTVRINDAIDNGITHIGENKVQEIMDKYEDIAKVNWHMIGHLQTNKVKYIIDKVELIHSLDRLSLAKEINKRAKQHNLVSKVLIQVNVAKEDSKFGLEAENIYDFLDNISGMENIKVEGLMTIAPFEEDPEDVRKYFKELKGIFDELKEKNLNGIEMKYLSMGMTNDFKVAIEEGANMVRVGTGIFGKRNYI